MDANGDVTRLRSDSGARWRRLEALLVIAMDLPGDARDAFLARECAGDDALAAELRALLAAHDEAGMLDRPLARWTAVPAEASHAHLAPGSVVAQRYEIHEQLGAGGMGVVYRARDLRLERTVALKFLPPALSADAHAKRRFLVEARAAAALEHVNVCTVHEIGETNAGQLYIAMAFVEGESLRRVIERGPLPPAQAMAIASQLAAALGAAHARGIVHRDVKPANVMLGPGGVVKLVDFGVAKLEGSTLTGGAATPGTTAYMSPEQVGSEDVDHRTDVWALGVVLYEMLAGTRPFAGPTDASIVHAITMREPAPLRALDPRIPPALDAIVARALAKDRRHRFQSADEIRESLLHAEERGAPPVRPRPRLSRRSRAALSGAAAGLVAIATIVGVRSWWPVKAGADVIAVIPLGTTGDSALARLGRDLVVTLSANLDGVGELRAVDPLTVIARAPQALRLDRAQALGRELGARSVLHGSLVHEGALVRANLVLSPVEGGEPIARVSAAASVDSVRLLTDVLTAEILERVWRRGRPPSAVLSEVTTRSNDALRAFLAGERYFDRFQSDSAIAEYTRATQADTMFAQAYLRIDEIRNRSLLPPDTAVRRRLAGLMDRLPRRDRDVLSLGSAAGLTPRQHIDSAMALAGRYPDHPSAQYQAADRIIHGGPMVGVPVASALPYLDRLDVLAPQHADNAFHRIMVTEVIGDTAALAAVVKRLTASPAGMITYLGRSLDAALAARGSAIAATTVAEQLRPYAAVVRATPGMGWIPTENGTALTPRAVLDSALGMGIATGVFANMEPVAISARGHLAIARGDFARGIALLSSLETSPAPIPIRAAAARHAALGGWLGTVSATEADSALTRARANVPDAAGVDAAELAWLDGVIGVVAGDSMRVERARAAIVDTTLTSRRLRTSLHALWRERRTNSADALIALEDSAIARPGMLSSAMFLHRLAVGRALTRAGDPARAEYYLQWTDTRFADARASSVQYALQPYNSYQRGLAFDIAGDRSRAMLHLERFVRSVDLVPPALARQMEDAKVRLARLAGDSGR